MIRRNHLDAPFLKACEQRFADICEGRIPVPKDMVVVRDISIIKRIRAGELPKSWEKSQNIVYKFNFIHTDDVLKQYIYDDKMTSMASAFCGYGLKVRGHRRFCRVLLSSD